MALDDYSVSKSSRTCAKTGRTLEPGELCIATLCERDEGQLERVDFALDAWSDEDRPKGFFSMWRTRVPSDDGPRRAFVDNEALLDLFSRLEGDARRERQAFRYVLGLVLLRKRLLKFEGRRDGEAGEVWLMRPRGVRAGASGASDNGPPMEVIDPGMSETDIIAVNEQLGEILHGDLG